MEEHGIVRIDGMKSKAGLVVTRDVRKFQILGGYLTMEDDTVIATGRAKQRKLSWLMSKLERPVVFCRFVKELDDVAEILRDHYDNVAVLSGAIKDKKRNKARSKIVEDFQSKKIDALAVQARTGGTSIEFSSTRDLVFYSMGYSYIDFQQIIARCRRYGQERRVRVWFIIVRDTIDEEPMKRIELKRETVDPIMTHIKEKSHGREEGGQEGRKKGRNPEEGSGGEDGNRRGLPGRQARYQRRRRSRQAA
jgi:SNF2 family DNA or RNA helicase